MLLLLVEAMVNTEWPSCKRKVVGSTPTTGSTFDQAFCVAEVPRCRSRGQRGTIGVLVPHRPPGLVGLFRGEHEYLCLIFGR